MSERDLDGALRAEESDDAEDRETLDRLPGARAVLEEALGKLSNPRREVLLLRMRGLEFADINRILGEPDNPVTDNAWVKRATRAEDELTEIALELAAGKPQLEQAIRAQDAYRKAERKKSRRKNTKKEEGTT